MASEVRTPSSFERELLRKSVVALAAGATRCSDCGRTPLLGERVHHFGGGAVACELCLPLRRESPDASEVVRGREHGHAVRLTDRRAA